MRIISLDLSTKSTGIAVFNDNVLEEYDCYQSSSRDVIKRIYFMGEQFKKMLDKYPDVSKVIIEEVRPENNQRGTGNKHTHRVLMWLQAYINFTLHDNGSTAEVEYLYPSEWRAVCGIKNGRGIKREQEKQYDVEFVKNKFNITVNDDIADAIAIGYAYLNKENEEDFN